MIKLERIILTSKPVSSVRNRSKSIVLPGFRGLPLHDVYRVFKQQVRRNGLSIRAASISFNLIMAIPAATMFLCTLIPYLPVSKQIFSNLLELVNDVTPNKDARRLVSSFLEDFFIKPKTGLLSIGFVLLIFYASNAMAGIIRSFDHSLVEKRKANFIKKRWRAIRLTIVLIFLLIGTMLISVGQGVLFETIMKWLAIKNKYVKWLIQNLRWIVIVFVFLYSIAFIYKYAPSVTRRFKLFSPGAVLATVLIILATAIFSYWAQNLSNYNKFYGSIGTILILMTLLFYNSLMLLIGYELNLSISHLYHQRIKQAEGKVIIQANK